MRLVLLNYLYCCISGFLFGIIITYLFLKTQNKKDGLYILLENFKKSIEDIKLQNELNTNEVKNAIKKASDLADILTTNQNLKGRYGEDCLENVLKACFPQNNLNYIKQFYTKNADNKVIKPDYLVNLPNNKSILIDCKLNLEKYIEYKENKDENLVENLKSDFIKDLNNTINSLASKKYESANNISQIDFILMYIPLETVLTSIYTDKDFLSVIKNANEKNIIIVGNSSILTTIRLVNKLWVYNSQEENMQNIVNTATDIYEYISLHTQKLIKIKNTLNENNEIFNEEFEKLTLDNKFIKNVEKLRNYGIQPPIKKISKNLNEVQISSEFLN